MEFSIKKLDMDGKKDILAMQNFVAQYGNGLGAYNFYRRTRRCNNIQVKIPKGTTTIDLSGKIIYPSFIDLYSDLGIKKPKRDFSRGRRPHGLFLTPCFLSKPFSNSL